jgi:hypothetical protein
MPLVQGDPDDTVEKPGGRIRHTRRMLRAAAAIMSVLLIASSIVTTYFGWTEGNPIAYLLKFLAFGERRYRSCHTRSSAAGGGESRQTPADSRWLRKPTIMRRPGRA